MIIIASVVAYAFTHFQPTTQVELGTGVYKARLAKDYNSRALGLSGVESLQPDQALLMVFEEDGLHEIWMQDMNIPIDIVWLNSDKEVVHIVKKASPDDSTDRIFTPSALARYVLEIPAGSSQQNNITIGSKAIFKIAGEEK